MDKEIYDKYSKMCGFLDKKKNFLLSQKRYFRILNGKSLVYSDQEDTEVKGVIEIDQIQKIRHENNKT